jgi:hypothetical protein
LLNLLWKTSDARNIVRPMLDMNLSRSEYLVEHFDYMCGRWVSQDEPDVSRYVSSFRLSGLQHKKVM